MNPELSEIHLSRILLLVALTQIAQHQRGYMQSGEYVVFVMEEMIDDRLKKANLGYCASVCRLLTSSTESSEMEWMEEILALNRGERAI